MSESKRANTTVRIGKGQIEALRYINNTREISIQELSRHLQGIGAYVSKQQVVKGVTAFIKVGIIEDRGGMMKLSVSGKKLLEVLELLIVEQSSTHGD